VNIPINKVENKLMKIVATVVTELEQYNTTTVVVVMTVVESVRRSLFCEL
jgi:hypothetical protein